MRVNLFRAPNCTFVWPDLPDPKNVPEGYVGPTFPDEDKITFHLKRISHSVRRSIENAMMGMSSKGFQKGSKTKGSEDVQLEYKIGTVKDKKLTAAVVRWENVLDEDGKPIQYSVEGLQDLIGINAGLDSAVYGHLENDLLNFIDSTMSFADTQGVSPKNSQTVSSQS